MGRMYLPQQGVDRIALHKMKVCCRPTLLGPCLHACTGPELGVYSMASTAPKLVGRSVWLAGSASTDIEADQCSMPVAGLACPAQE